MTMRLDPEMLRARAKFLMNLADTLDQAAAEFKDISKPWRNNGIQLPTNGEAKPNSRIVFVRTKKAINEPKIAAALAKMPKGARDIVLYFDEGGRQKATIAELSAALQLAPKSVGNYIRPLRKLSLFDREPLSHVG